MTRDRRCKKRRKPAKAASRQKYAKRRTTPSLVHRTSSPELSRVHSESVRSVADQKERYPQWISYVPVVAALIGLTSALVNALS